MFNRWWSSRVNRHEDDTTVHERGGQQSSQACQFNGQLSEIDTSSSEDEEGASSSSDESEEEVAYLEGSPRTAAASEDDTKQAKPSTIVNLMLAEVGHRGGALFNWSGSQERVNERRRLQRLVNKKGNVQIARHKVADRKMRYLTDIYSSMLDAKWRYVILMFNASFFVSWFAFAIVWWLILYFRDDFLHEHLPDEQETNEWQPCVLGMYDFASCFLFSVETQHTIGYGTRQTTEKCPEAIFMQSIQSVAGVIIQACLVGTIFAKLARPKKRMATLLFSRNAVICNRDGVLTLLFRVANLRPSHVIEAHVRAILVSRKVTEEGEIIPYHQTELNIGIDLEGEEDSILLIWPTTLIHPIDEESPFYKMSAKDFYSKHYEIILVMEGIVEPTGMSMQVRTSYVGDEILWGYRFVNVLHYAEGRYQVDYSAFDQVEKVVEAPTTSAKQQAKFSRGSRNGERKDSSTRTRAVSAPNPTPARVQWNQNTLPRANLRSVDLPSRPLPKVSIPIGSSSTLPSAAAWRQKVRQNSVDKANSQLQSNSNQQHRPKSMIVNPTHQ